ncbi:agamous-like MADS-box protein AGL97 [Arabidopsis lyrata subsp. lyrata]|uniref:agamous-like MADS-box protein AGL97 n=1 Tax=Arabidopsis lyrata subsp. lyrata TaxID=81972 RepID=UPI000A29D629|nr:agamous-like MADS-box protein AGL97 [Arabidopsis lyrata subsp. lyrata]|eukprot:XP_020871775.1 agamous-like MADS-box protein AGL97 [Arabidopsis lyrata subsp. lyrata]
MRLRDNGLHLSIIFLHTKTLSVVKIEKIIMVKKGGTKRKIAIEMIQKSDYLRVTCTKRREGLFSKASQLCLLSDAQIAILATPPSSESNVSFYSFGHSSVDTVVSSFLSGQRPVPVQEDTKETREDVGICLSRKNLGLGFWWNNESLNKSENPQEISDAIDSMWTLLSNLKELSAEEALLNDHKDLKKNEKSEHGTQDQTLNLKSNTSAICCIPNELPANFNEIVGISPNSLIMLENKKSQIEERFEKESQVCVSGIENEATNSCATNEEEDLANHVRST